MLAIGILAQKLCQRIILALRIQHQKRVNYARIGRKIEDVHNERILRHAYCQINVNRTIKSRLKSIKT